ncbi:hypothetical protein [Deinococcus cavernae]|nr:hypothetical protein [Deinococcus cavernae]
MSLFKKGLAALQEGRGERATASGSRAMVLGGDGLMFTPEKSP